MAIRPLISLLVLPTLTLVSRPAAGQEIRGTLIDETTRSAVAGAYVILLDSAGLRLGAVPSDSAGEFLIRPPLPGRYSLWVDHLGYAHVLSPLLDVARDEPVAVEIRLDPAPVALDPIVVTADARERSLQRVGFYDRRKLGIGRFVTREEIDRATPTRTSDLFMAMPGVELVPSAHLGGYDIAFRRASRISGGGDGGTGTCLPNIVVNGMMVRPAEVVSEGAPSDILDNLVNPSEIEAIEAYPSNIGLPARYAGMNAQCGVVLIWLRR